MCKNEIQTEYIGYERALDELEQELRDRGIYVSPEIQEVIDDLREDRIDRGK